MGKGNEDGSGGKGCGKRVGLIRCIGRNLQSWLRGRRFLMIDLWYVVFDMEDEMWELFLRWCCADNV